MKKNYQAVTLRIPLYLYKKLKRSAFKKQISMNLLVREIIKKELSRKCDSKINVADLD